jgi:two-component system, OmpR family, sensor kinase
VALRTRLLLGTLLIVVAVLVFGDVVVYRSLDSFLRGRVDQQLESAMWAAPRVLDLEGRPEAVGGGGQELRPLIPSGTYFAWVDEHGAVRREVLPSVTQGLVDPAEDTSPAPPRLPGGLPGTSGSTHVADALRITVEAADGSTEYRLLADATSEGGTIVVAIPLTNVHGTLARLLRIEIGVSLAALAAIGLLGWWLVRRGLRPLERMAEESVHIAEGDLSRRVGPADDRTEVGRLGLALNSMLARIEEAFEHRQRSEDRLRRFLADASHELRTPATSIRGYAELFRRGAAEHPEDLAKAMRQIEREGARVGQLVDEMLLLARLDEGLPLERAHVDLALVAAEAVEAACDLSPDRRIQLVAHGPVLVVGDVVRLRQVADNLLSNACRYAPADTPVTVGVRREGPAAFLEVIDEGPGVESEDAERIFERFYRVDASRSREKGGAGLGLSIAAAIAEAHGGRVSYERRSPRGSVFRVLLPSAERVP